MRPKRRRGPRRRCCRCATGFRRCRSSRGGAADGGVVWADQASDRRDLRERRHRSGGAAARWTTRAAGRTPAPQCRGASRAAPYRDADDVRRPARRGRRCTRVAIGGRDAEARDGARGARARVRPAARGRPRELALRVVLRGLHGDARSATDPARCWTSTCTAWLGSGAARRGPGKLAAVHHAGVGAPRHGHVHRGRRLRRRRERRARSTLDRRGLRPQRRRHTHNFVAGGIVTHNCDLRLPRSRHQEHPQFPGRLR